MVASQDLSGGSGVLVEWESPVPSSGSVLGSNPTKAFGFLLKGVAHWKKRNLPFALQEKQVWAMPFAVTRAISVMMSLPSPTNGAQDLHENLLSIGDTAFLGYQIKMNWTDLYTHTQPTVWEQENHQLLVLRIHCYTYRSVAKIQTVYSYCRSLPSTMTS